jgi:nitroreductase
MPESKVLDIIKERFSVRQYKDQPIEEDKLAMILEAARLAPSASNSLSPNTANPSNRL